MQKTLLFIIHLLICASVQAQSVADFMWQEKKTIVEMNVVARKAATYILSTPADTTNTTRIAAAQYLTTWMRETDSTYIYATSLDIGSILNENKEQGYVFWAAMVDAVLNNKEHSTDKAVAYAAKRLVAYTRNKHNKLHPGATLTEMIAADKKGKLSEYLDKMNAVGK